MSRDWTQEELALASSLMKKAGHMSFEEFCAELDIQTRKHPNIEPNPTTLPERGGEKGVDK